jgi:hypothetical protein
MIRSLFTRSRTFAAAILALTFAAGGPFGPSVLDAQGPPDLEAQHQRLLPLFEQNGVIFTDADETIGRLVVGVVNRGLEQAVRARLAALGVSSASVDVVVSEPIVQVATLRDRIRPVVGGLQIRFSGFLCSLSFNAVREGVLGYVTASHCSDYQGTVDGTLYYQPLNQVADEFIGQEIADPGFFSKSNGCPKGRRCRYSDANFSSGANGVDFALGRIAQTTGANNGLLDLAAVDFTISAEGAAVKNEIASKVGRTTGWSRGPVSKTCANTGVLGSNIVFLCQNFVNATVASGDSGSPVFKEHPDGSIILMGTLWGGNSSGTQFVYSPLAGVERELGALSTCAAGYGC